MADKSKEKPVFKNTKYLNQFRALRTDNLDETGVEPINYFREPFPRLTRQNESNRHAKIRTDDIDITGIEPHNPRQWQIKSEFRIKTEDIEETGIQPLTNLFKMPEQLPRYTQQNEFKNFVKTGKDDFEVTGIVPMPVGEKSFQIDMAKARRTTRSSKIQTNTFVDIGESYRSNENTQNEETPYQKFLSSIVKNNQIIETALKQIQYPETCPEDYDAAQQRLDQTKERILKELNHLSKKH